MERLTQEQKEQATQIAKFVVENGRVLTDGSANFQRASMAVEVSFEAYERDIDIAIADAMGDYAAQELP